MGYFITFIIHIQIIWYLTFKRQPCLSNILINGLHVTLTSIPKLLFREANQTRKTFRNNLRGNPSSPYLNDKHHSKVSQCNLIKTGLTGHLSIWTNFQKYRKVHLIKHDHRIGSLSGGQNFCEKLHQKLSRWHLLVQFILIISSKWQHLFCLGNCCRSWCISMICASIFIRLQPTAEAIILLWVAPLLTRFNFKPSMYKYSQAQ